MNLTYSQLLRGNRNFRNLLWGQVVSELGNWFNFIAGLGLVRIISDGSPMAAAILMVCRTLPFALVLPFAGTFVDRFSRRQVMLVTDLARVFLALIFLLVTAPEHLWIAFTASVLLSVFSAFFEAAKNAASPNVAGKEGLLAGTALMFSSRFLLMGVGAALGGWAAAIFGYKVAFIINSASFLISAYSIWLIPESATREAKPEAEKSESNPEIIPEKVSFISDMKDGWKYLFREPLVFTIVLLNLIWATGAGAINIVFDQLGGKVFGLEGNWNADSAVAFLYTASGFGLFAGMIVAHRVGSFVERKNLTNGYIGWSLIIHGILFAAAGITGNFYLVIFLIFISRAIVGAEYAVQETMLQRNLPDYIRGRILTLDRGLEITVFSISTYLAGISLYKISPQMLTVISGIMSGSAGLVWFLRKRREREKSLRPAEAVSEI